MLIVCPTCHTDCYEGTSFCPSCGGHLKQTDDPFVDRLVGKYKIEERIGDGGCSTVYRARHVENGRLFAVKVLLPQYSKHEEMVERFRREALVLSQLGHANIVKIEDFGWVSGVGFYLTMEWLEGETVKDYVFREGAFRKEEVLYFFAQLLDALNTAHIQGVVHRDLKLENLMLTPNSRGSTILKVLDFGVAYIAQEGQDRLTSTGLVVGTPRYMAPEQVRGENTKINNRTDLYSSGLMLFEMLTGQPAFQRDTVQQLLYCQLDEMPPLLSQTFPEGNFGLELEQVVRKSVQKEQSERFTSAYAFYEALEKAMQTEGVHLPRQIGSTPDYQQSSSYYSLISPAYGHPQPALEARQPGATPVIKTPASVSKESTSPDEMMASDGAFQTLAMTPGIALQLEQSMTDAGGMQSVGSAHSSEVVYSYKAQSQPQALPSRPSHSSSILPRQPDVQYSAKSLDSLEEYSVATDKSTPGVTPSGSNYLASRGEHADGLMTPNRFRQSFEPNLDDDSLHYSPLSLQDFSVLRSENVTPRDPSPISMDSLSPNEISKRHIFWLVAIPAVVFSFLMVWIIQTMVKPATNYKNKSIRSELPSPPKPEPNKRILPIKR